MCVCVCVWVIRQVLNEFSFPIGGLCYRDHITVSGFLLLWQRPTHSLPLEVWWKWRLYGRIRWKRKMTNNNIFNFLSWTQLGHAFITLYFLFFSVMVYIVHFKLTFYLPFISTAPRVRLSRSRRCVLRGRCSVVWRASWRSGCVMARLTVRMERMRTTAPLSVLKASLSVSMLGVSRHTGDVMVLFNAGTDPMNKTVVSTCKDWCPFSCLYSSLVVTVLSFLSCLHSFLNFIMSFMLLKSEISKYRRTCIIAFKIL